MNCKTTAKVLLAATLGVAVMGTISYLTATGKAVIGPDPESLDAQRAAIAINTLWWMLACFAGSAGAFVLSRRDAAPGA